MAAGHQTVGMKSLHGGSRRGNGCPLRSSDAGDRPIDVRDRPTDVSYRPTDVGYRLLVAGRRPATGTPVTVFFREPRRHPYPCWSATCIVSGGPRGLGVAHGYWPGEKLVRG